MGLKVSEFRGYRFSLSDPQIRDEVLDYKVNGDVSLKKNFLETIKKIKEEVYDSKPDQYGVALLTKDEVRKDMEEQAKKKIWELKQILCMK